MVLSVPITRSSRNAILSETPVEAIEKAVVWWVSGFSIMHETQTEQLFRKNTPFPAVYLINIFAVNILIL